MDKKKNIECPICLEEIIFLVRTPCKHIYCFSCLLNFNETSCPLCRRELKKFMPEKMLQIILNNQKNKICKSDEIINIHSIIQFPPL